MRNRRIIFLFVILIFSLGLFGCGKKLGKLEKVEITSISLDDEMIKNYNPHGYASGRIHLNLIGDGVGDGFLYSEYVIIKCTSNDKHNSSELRASNLKKDENGFYTDVDGLLNGEYELILTGMYKKTPKNLSADKLIDFSKENSYTVAANFKVDESFDTEEEIANLNKEYAEKKQEEYLVSTKEESHNTEIGNYTENGIEIVSQSSDGNFIYAEVKNIADYDKKYVKLYYNIYSDEECKNLITQAYTNEKIIKSGDTVTLRLAILADIDSKFWFKLDRIVTSN